MAGTALAPAGSILLTLWCAVCGTRIPNVRVDAVLDEDGDLAYDARQLAWFVMAHHEPRQRMQGRLL